MRDPYFGHRDFFTGEPLRDKDEWTDWDYALVAAYQTVQDMTNKHGLLVHEVESDRVMVSAVKKIDRFQAQVDRATKGSKAKGYTPDPGEYFEPKLELRFGDEWPTLEDHWADLAERSSD